MQPLLLFEEIYFKKDSFWLTMTTHLSFEALKQAIPITPGLALPTISQIFVLQVDASSVGIGVILLQTSHCLF